MGIGATLGKFVKQGEIYWYAFRAPDKHRPVLILTRNSAISLLTGITIAPLTIRIRDIPSEVVITPEEDSVPETCVVNTDNIQTIQKENLRGLITELSPVRMREVIDAVRFSLGFDDFE